MPDHIYQLPKWPKFQWDQNALANPLAALRHRQGRFVGRMEALGFPIRSEAMHQTLTQDVVKSSEIEGEDPRSGTGALIDRAGLGSRSVH